MENSDGAPAGVRVAGKQGAPTIIGLSMHAGKVKML
jgi:hypothetical protein